MDIISLTDQLHQIINVKATKTSDNKLNVSNALDGFEVYLNPQDIIETDFIYSPTGQQVLQLYYNTGGGIIVTPDDYVFNVEQDEMVQVSDAPPMCSIREMLNGLENYRMNPMPTDNFDNCVGLFYMHYYIVKSAKAKGFNVEQYLVELDEIGNKYGFKM